MYSLAASAWPLPTRTLADDREAAQLSAIHEARIAGRRSLQTASVGDQGVLARIRRVAGFDPTPADCACPA